jgi:hypothetical protein
VQAYSLACIEANSIATGVVGQMPDSGGPNRPGVTTCHLKSLIREMGGGEARKEFIHCGHSGKKQGTNVLILSLEY